MIDRLNHKNDKFEATLNVEGKTASSTSLPISYAGGDKVMMRYGQAELHFTWEGDEMPRRLEVDPRINFISSATGKPQSNISQRAHVYIGEKDLTVRLSPPKGEPGFLNGRLTFVDPATNKSTVIPIGNLAVDDEKNRDPRIVADHKRVVFAGEPLGDISISLFDPNPLEVREANFVAEWEFRPANGGDPKRIPAEIKWDAGEKADIERMVQIKDPGPMEEPGDLRLQVSVVDPRFGAGSVEQSFPICSKEEKAKVLFDTQYLPVGNDPTDVSIPLNFLTPIKSASANPDRNAPGQLEVFWVAKDGVETDLTGQSRLRKPGFPGRPPVLPRLSVGSDSCSSRLGAG